MGPEPGEGPVDAALMARICWHYFKKGQTQDAIAQRLKMTCKRVNRTLGEARESGARPGRDLLLHYGAYVCAVARVAGRTCRREPIRAVLAVVPKLDLALLSAIDLSELSKPLEYGVISRQNLEVVARCRRSWGYCGHYLDADGRPIAHPLTERVINPSLDDLLRVPELVLAVHHPGRHSRKALPRPNNGRGHGASADNMSYVLKRGASTCSSEPDCWRDPSAIAPRTEPATSSRRSGLRYRPAGA